jgi:hypothetical protein
MTRKSLCVFGAVQHFPQIFLSEAGGICSYMGPVGVKCKLYVLLLRESQNGHLVRLTG